MAEQHSKAEQKRIAQVEENIHNLVKLWQANKAVETAETSLRKFVELAWPHFDPAPFTPGWHIDLICDHLEAMTDGHIRKLIINISPRSSKSSLIAICWPAWVWITKPELKWLFSSYDLRLSTQHSRMCRQLIKSPWYQRNWGTRYKINPVADKLQRFDNDKLGFRIATSSNAGIVGEGGDFVCQDDPSNLGEMHSEAHVEEVIRHHVNVLSSRFNDRKTGRHLIVQQRGGENDLTGYVLANEEGWEHVVVPMEYEGDKRRTVIGFQDPRTKIGELMCPARFGPAEAAEEKKKPMVWAGQYQQRPAPGEGAKFKREWWNFYNPPGVETAQPILLRVPGGEVIKKTPVPIPSAFEQVCHGWDLAFKDKETNDFVSGQVWARVGSNSFLLARDTRHMDFPETVRAIRKMSAEFPCPEKMVEGKANGPAVIQTLRNEIPGLIESPIDGGLGSLANSMTGYAEAGNWFLPNPNIYPWVWDFIEVFAAYPNGKHDDDVAACCHANRRLYDSVSNSAVPEFRVQPRFGEPVNACHVSDGMDRMEPYWRRWIAVSPGAALWFCETPRQSLRIYREMDLDRMDAHEAGRLIAQATLPDVQAFINSAPKVRTMAVAKKWNIDVLMPKEAFEPVDPIGCYAELVEEGMLSFEPQAEVWEDRQIAKQEIKMARFSSQMAETGDGAWDRLRDLLRFQPPDFKTIDFDRQKAYKIACRDIQEYKQYMAAVDGRIEGEWPKIKFAPSCKGVIQALGGVRRAESDPSNPFLRALLLGISAPESMMTEKPLKEVPWSGRSIGRNANSRMLRRA